MLLDKIEVGRREQRVHVLKTKLEDLSQRMLTRAKSLKTNVMSIRKDPEILQLWNQLCQHHMEAIVLCTSFDERPRVCSAVLRPLGCVEIMHLSDEQTCCSKFLKRVSKHY
jgi:hypothetical protein